MHAHHFDFENSQRIQSFQKTHYILELGILIMSVINDTNKNIQLYQIFYFTNCILKFISLSMSIGCDKFYFFVNFNTMAPHLKNEKNIFYVVPNTQFNIFNNF